LNTVQDNLTAEAGGGVAWKIYRSSTIKILPARINHWSRQADTSSRSGTSGIASLARGRKPRVSCEYYPAKV